MTDNISREELKAKIDRGDEFVLVDAPPREADYEVRSTVVETITREQLEETLDRGDDFVLVDTLGEEYYRQSHLPGAISLPLEEID